MRVAVLWTCLSGYLNACLKELAGRAGVELFVCNLPSEKEAPFDDDDYAWIPNHHVLRSASDYTALQEKLRAFKPHLVVISGWHIPTYRTIAKELAGKCLRVMVMDNGWKATPKQWLGTFVASWYVRPITDLVWLPGERQAAFARRLGFAEEKILWGSFSCDRQAIEPVHLNRIAEKRPLPHSFLFLGRFVPEKGICDLINAYRAYREKSTAAWPLVCCGAGPLESDLRAQQGIRVEGFVQPHKLPAVLASAGCLILPSRFEPWALVVHEAATAGLPILASRRVGATVHLVQPNFNGFLFNSGDVGALTRLMVRMSAMSDERLETMSRRSYLLSEQFSPRRWADTLLDAFEALA